MQVIDFIAAYGPWAWIVAGLVLLALELIVPGGFLLWMGISGIITGLIVLFGGENGHGDLDRLCSVFVLVRVGVGVERGVITR